MVLRRITAVTLLAAVTACSSAGGGSSLPAASTGSQALTKSGHRQRVKAHLVIKVRQKKHRGKHARGVRYVSPATASLAYSIDGQSQPVVNISTSNPNCQVVGPISYLQCDVSMTLSPGNHTFSFTTYDGSNGTGNVLSANTNVSYDVKTGEANQIPVILGGVASSLAVIPLNGSLAVYGNAPQKFNIVPLDADDNFIIGPGAPQPVVQTAPANMTMSTPSPSSPNVWTFASTYAASDPTVSADATIAVSATPVPNSGGATVTANTDLKLYQPWILVVSNFGATSQFYDEQGNQIGTTSGFFNGSNIGAVEYSPDTQWVYSDPFFASGVAAFNVQGTSQTTAGSWANYSAPFGMAYDANDHFLYVAMNRNSSPASINVYDDQGNQQAVAGSWANVSYPRGIAYDPHNHWIYVANCTSSCGAVGGTTDTITAYDEQGNQQTLSGSWAGIKAPEGIAYDPHDGLLYITSNSSNTVTAYDEQGNQQTLAGSWSGVTLPFDVKYDPYDGLLYVTNNGSGTVTAYDEQGNQQTLRGTGFNSISNVTHLVIVP